MPLRSGVVGSLAALAVAVLAASANGAQVGELDPTFGAGGYLAAASSTAMQATAATGAGGDELLVAGVFGDGPTGVGMVERLSADGSLDPLFGVGGRVLLAGTFLARAVAVAPGGKVMVALSAASGSEVVRLLADGSVDPSYGVAGVVNLPSAGAIQALAVTSDGSVVAAGNEYDVDSQTGTVSNQDMLAVRLTPAGQLDGSFGASGLARIDLGGRDQANAVAVDASGRVLMAGVTINTTTFVEHTAVVRLTIAGSPDPSFAGSGVLIGDLGGPVPGSEGYGLALDSAGRIVVQAASGIFTGVTLVARLLPDGSFDSSFGSGGLTTVGGFDWGALAVDASDRVVIAVDPEFGTATESTQVLRLLADGSRDPSFPSRVFDLSPGSEDVFSVVLSPTRIAVIGTAFARTPPFLTIVGLRLVAEDTTPVISSSVNGPIGTNGWYTGDVSVHFSVSAPSGVNFSTSGCNDSTVVQDTSAAGLSFTCVATSDFGDSVTGIVTVKRDATPPTVVCPQQVPAFLLNQQSPILGASLFDASSGPDPSFTSPQPQTSAIGVKNVNVGGSDLAGNTTAATCSYRVTYDFHGWAAPLANPPTLNVANAGWALLFSYQLFDGLGNIEHGVTQPSLTWQQVTCPAGAAEQSVPNSGGDVGFKEFRDGRYQLGIRSPKNLGGTCQLAQLGFGEGQPRIALFRFR